MLVINCEQALFCSVNKNAANSIVRSSDKQNKQSQSDAIIVVLCGSYLGF